MPQENVKSPPHGSVGASDEVRRAERMELFAARALEFEEVRAVLERLAPTSLGLRTLRMLAPRTDVLARAALERSREMIRLAHQGLEPSFSGVSDPAPPLAQARRAGRALADEAWAALRDFLEATKRLAEWLLARANEVPALAALATGLPDFTDLFAALDAAVDERGRVRDQASPLLARLRKEAAELSQEMDRALRALVARPEIKAVLSDPNPHRRGGRPVLAVRAKSQGRVPGIVHDRSQTGESVFIEPREVVRLGNRAVEIDADERREVERILLELTRIVLAREEAIAEAAERLGELELALIGARYAAEAGAHVPQIAPGLLLRGASHPLLLEQKRLGRLREVVPIDVRLGDEFDLLILTGPNTGGKTLALKTAGLAAFFTRCGLPFPCLDGSTVPLYDGVMADIGDEQEISQSLSTFSSHLTRIKHGLLRATSQTLCLLDELGGGTDPDEGAALSEAILETLMERRAPTLASTHIGKLKEFAFRNPRAENACVEFDAATLRPRYRLLVGTPGESGALVIARRLGLPHKLVDRAQVRLVKRDAEVQKLMADVRKARTEAEKARTQAETRLSEAERTKTEMNAKQVEIERREELLETEAQRTIEERVREARLRLAKLGPLMEQVPMAQRKTLSEAIQQIDAELSGAALSERRKSFLDTIKKGSFVYLPRYRQRVAVQRVDHDKKELRVLLGGMNMTVSFDEVTAYESR